MRAENYLAALATLAQLKAMAPSRKRGPQRLAIRRPIPPPPTPEDRVRMKQIAAEIELLQAKRRGA